MRLSTLLALATPLAGAGAQSNTRRDPASTLPPSNSSGAILPKRFIVEASEGTSVEALTAKVEANGGKVLREFRSSIFTGVSVESADENIDTLQAVNEVTKAWHVSKIQLAPLKISATFADDAAAANFSVHSMTGVDKVHAAGHFGKGVTVAIVDTGTDYNHPALGGCFGPGCKVAGGWDFVGNERAPASGSKTPDSDPLDQVGHGTHVAGILAGKTDSFIGVAPDATILSYKVFSQASITDDDSLIDAFLMAFEAGADIITSSIGGDSGWSEGAWQEVASRLVEQGVIVTISAGNSGAQGPFFGSSGSSGKNVIAVAATEPNVISSPPFKASFYQTDGSVQISTLAYKPAFNHLWTLPEMPIIPVSLDQIDACSPLPNTIPDLSSGIALIRKGPCDYLDQQTNLAARGAKYILLYNDDVRVMNIGWIEPTSAPVALIEAKAGAALVTAVKAGVNITADFTLASDNSWSVGFGNSAGGIPADYSSWGPTNEMEIKPDVAAPGSEIFSSYIGGQWTVMSGTSMACPYVAGVAALWIGAFGGRSVHGPAIGKMIASRIITSGAAMPWQVSYPFSGNPIDYGFWAPVPQVGSGLVNASKVLTYQTTLSFDKFHLNDTGHFSRYHSADITNNSPKPVTYKFTLQPGGGFNAQDKVNSSFLSYGTDLDPVSIAPKVTFPSGTFTVKPGETKKAQFNFAPVTGLDETKLPIYSGKILISGSNGEELSIPYLGAAFDLKTAMRRNMFAGSGPWQVGAEDKGIDEYHTYDFNVSYNAQHYPRIYSEFKFGSKEMRFDIYKAGFKESNWKYPPVVGQGGYVGSATRWVHSPEAWKFDSDWYDKEETVPFPIKYMERTPRGFSYNPHKFFWFGKLANGTYIAPGDYSIRFAAQIPFSDPEHSDNWVVWKTPIITVLPYDPADKGLGSGTNPDAHPLPA